jgi:hypothetical protein
LRQGSKWLTERTPGFRGTQFERHWYRHAAVKLEIEVSRRCHVGTLYFKI